jgi:hypothetical protein
MNRRSRWVIGLACALWAGVGTMAQAQFVDFPGGFGGFGWGGWGGVGTPDSQDAMGMGFFAAGLGTYEKKSAIGRSIDTETIIRWNEYMHETQETANRARLARRAQQSERNRTSTDAIQKRLRDNPDARDVLNGAALNAALEDIDDPRVYLQALRGAKVRIGADRIRNIPFRYGAGAITIGIHQLATSSFPQALSGPEFAADREALKTLDQQLFEEIDDDKDVDAALVNKFLAAIYATEERVAKTLPANGLQRAQADKFLKAIHGLVVMLKTPPIGDLVAGVDKRPDASLGELLRFMTAYRLRFGAAATPQQQEVYRFLYPLLDELRDQVAPALATTAPPKIQGTEAEDFFSVLSYDDLQKKAPKP